ncbi:hypothetical protein B0H19DRAFT_1078173 [Mycena capillaripes]|nr:hypothetical protein B0H19DRAFT_1078173 [Mycena capillaripes]
MAESAFGCAQNADGTLRDASEIDFYEDRDDESPLPRPTASSSSLHPFFTRSAKPVGKVAGSHRSSRKSLPSKCLMDSNNAESSVSAGKRKADSAPVTSRHPKVPRRSNAASSDSESEAEESAAGDSDTDDVVGGDTEGEDGPGQEVMDVDTLEEYNSIKAMADADHTQAVAKPAGPDSTADVRTVFRRVKDYKNPTTGAVESGSLCKICVDTGSDKTFFAGSVTTLRLHIARAKGRYAVYKARCDKLSIEVNERAIPKTHKSQGVQGTLDCLVVSTPRLPVFTPEGLPDFLIELIVTQDEAFMLIEAPSLRRLLQYLKPTLKDSDIPTRKTLRTHILARAKEVELDLCKRFKALFSPSIR